MNKENHKSSLSLTDLIFTYVFIVFFHISSFGQYNGRQYELIHNNGEFYVEYEVSAKETLYGISRIFKSDIEKIRETNSYLEQSTLSSGDKLLIPIDLKLIDFMDQGNSSFYYKVRNKETLYTLSKLYLDRPMDWLRSLNNLTSHHLSSDQLLIFGYLNIDLPVYSVIDHYPQTETSESVKRADHENEIRNEEVFDDIIEYSEIAFRQNDKTSDEGKYVFYNKCKSGEEIELYYPLTNKHMTATVIDNIPLGVYPTKADIVLSEVVAEMLGVRDRLSRVTVRMKEKYENKE